MEETSNLKRRRQTLAKAQSLNVPTTTTASTNDRRRRRGGYSSAVEAYYTEEHRDENADGGMEEDNSEMWNDFSNRFRQVQSVLDRNRLLIQQVNENHQARSHNNMVQNVGLIQELNGNISKVVSLYSDLSTNFSTVFHQGNDAIGDENNDQRHL
ncbi:PREDICTED: protein EARLY FLOWERING 4-like [Nicotiana attenuata]|uniref:Protein early flowering 4 n=1 Tax=Nicotiana attenuata TaxID=49451 RepID=A0A314KVF9_NICAT|nr:PREDICTED: protein EARLY FLOWERING 4-like [Nicotiana attenuata]OIT33368.1 protein early flowering 4 [Nicotiana attenuata]